MDAAFSERAGTARFTEDLREPLLGDAHEAAEASPTVFRGKRRSGAGRLPHFTRTTSELPMALTPELGGRDTVSIPVLFARVAAKCGQELLDKVDAVDCHAAFDATLEHACRLYETVCYENLAPDSPAAQGFQFVGDKPLRREPGAGSRWTHSGTDADLGGHEDGQECGHGHGHGHAHGGGGGARGGRRIIREVSHALHADPEEHGGAGDEHGGGDEGHGHGGGSRGGESHHLRFRRQNSPDSIDGELPAVMSKEALAKALEHEGFHGLMAEPAFEDLWGSLGKEAIDVSTFHTVLRLLKLHLLCGVLQTDPDYERRLVPRLEEETGLVRVLDWNARSIDEMSFEKSDLTDMFLTHRRSKMKMRWVHCAQVGRLTLCRLAVKYQLHPLPVEDSIKLGNQSMPVVRKYGSNFFLVIPMLRLSTRSKEMLECYRENTSKGWAADIKESMGRQRCTTDFATPPMQAKGSDNKRAHAVSGPCVVEVEQGRLALFVSGSPNYDTVISVQTKWLLRHLESGGSHFDPSEHHNHGRRRLTTLRGRVGRFLASWAGRGKKIARDMDADMVPAVSSRMRNFPFAAAGSTNEPFGRQGSAGASCSGEEEEYMGTEPFDLVAQEVRKDFSVLRAGNASWLLWRLLDVCVDELTPILAAYRARLQWFSAYIAKQRAKASLDVEKQLLRSKVELDWLQRKARPMVRIVRHLVRERAIESDVTRYIEDVEDHLETFIEEMSRSMGVCDSLREQVRSYRDRQQQSVLYVLAIVTTLFTPMQLLTGVYGMNWQDPDGLPVVPGFGPLKDDRGWYLFWGLGTLIVASLYLTFRLILKWI